MKRHSDGFSLVEVIIAVAVLAVVAMSLLAYFSSANRYTNWGKTTQKADMAAQSVVEELVSCTTFDQVENGLVASGSGVWAVVSTPAPSDNSYRLDRSISVDGTDYKARVKLDFEPYKGASAADPTPLSKFNDYQAPQLEKVYSDKNVVLEETDQTETAIGDLFYQVYESDKSIKKETIRAGLSRKMYIKLAPYAASDGSTPAIYLVKGYYEYYYDYDEDTGKYMSEQPIKEVKIPEDSLERIYLFYRSANTSTPETLDITAEGFPAGFQLTDFSYYAIQQDETKKSSEEAAPTPSPYKLEITSGGSAASVDLKNKVYNNANKLGGGSDNLIVHESKDRIAMITVEIYYADETDFKEENRIVMVQTSKGA